jgi:S1-C subfamily serine protease
MRLLALLVLVVGLGACGQPESLRMVTVASTAKETGLALRELPSTMLRSLKLPYGLTVVKAGEAAERSGLRVGDVVYGVEQKRISSLEDFYKLVAERRGDTLRLLVRRGGQDLYVPIDLSNGHPGQPGIGPFKDKLLRT